MYQRPALNLRLPVSLLSVIRNPAGRQVDGASATILRQGLVRHLNRVELHDLEQSRG